MPSDWQCSDSIKRNPFLMIYARIITIFNRKNLQMPLTRIEHIYNLSKD
jgi:hypothetical protein